MCVRANISSFALSVLDEVYPANIQFVASLRALIREIEASKRRK